MSSSPPTSVPIINPVVASPTPPPPPPAPERPLQSPGGYFPSKSSRTPRSSQSPGNNAASPASLSRSSTLLQTPPISESQSRQDRGGYFSSKGSRNARITSPETHSTQSLSPGLSSGGSFHSSDTGQSPCSYSSSEFLSPPQFQGDSDKPPYIPRQTSLESLSMIKRNLRRAETIPNDRKIKIKRRHRRRRGCRHHQNRDQHYSCRGESVCQVAPTAPAGEKLLCRDHTGHFVPKHTRYGNTDTFGRLMAQSMPGPAPPVVTRRWSSVEVAAHQIRLQSTLRPQVPIASVAPEGSTTGGENDMFISKNLGRPYRSSSFTRGAINHDIVRAVREKLTVRKVATNQSNSPVQPPLSITLRRASGISGISGLSALNGRLTKSFADGDVYSEEDSGGTTPTASYQDHSGHGEPSAAYLITSEDIESITLLIAENIGYNSQPYNQKRALEDTSSAAQSSRNTKTPTVSSDQPTPLSPEPTISVADFRVTAMETPSHSDHLKVDDLQRVILRSGSDRSEHEIIWNGSRISTTSFGSSTFEGNTKHSDTSSESGASPEASPKTRQDQTTVDKGDAFDPNNARASISEWSWRLPQNDITMVVTSSDSDSNDIPRNTQRVKTKRRPPLRSAASTPKEHMTARVRPFPRYAASHEQLQDVVSFPPLSPRKATSEWFSPLPEMETTSAASKSPLTTSRSLYGLGVDVTIGPSGSAISAPFTSWVRSAEVSPSHSPRIDFKQDYGLGSQDAYARVDDGRRKSVIKPHPKATARTGESFAMGCSIGVHSSERRRSSAPRIQRVRTIDNIHKGERDEPPSRWRPPSICPPRLSPSQLSTSPAELEEPKERRAEERVPEMMTRLQRLRSGITDRISLVEARSPPTPKSDCAGIYGTITGTLRRSIAAPCEDHVPIHDCDDCAKDPRNPSVDWIG